MIEKLQEGATSPILYNFYGKLYNYNDLAKATDQGLNEYLSTLKRGEKDSDEFRAAYSDIMSGIKDGTITFEDGHFVDSKGRYRNSEKAKKDYYGLIANYIFNNMGKSDVYQTPEDPNKIKWDGTTGMKTALMRQLYNSDTPKLQDFLDLDAENNGTRSTANRITYLANALQNISDNWDNTFQGATDEDKTKYTQLLGSAISALRDGSIDAGDYLALSKLAGDVDFRGMFAKGTPAATVTANTPSTTETVTPTIKLKQAALSDSNYNLDSLNKITSALTRVPDKGLVSILRNSFYNKSYKFSRDSRVAAIFRNANISNKAGVTSVLNALYAKGKLKEADPENPNLYYIPGLRTKKGTGWVWDRANNTITEMLLENIPYAKAKLSLIPVNKKGGILFAQAGTQTPYWYSNITDYDPTKYIANWGKTLYGINDKGEYGTAYSNTGRGQNDSRYGADSGHTDYSNAGLTYATNVEGQLKYKDFTTALTDAAKTYQSTLDKSTLNDDNNLFLRWAHLVDKGLPQGSTTTFFDENGNLRQSWKVTNKDSYMRGPRGEITDLSDYITQVRNDQILANRHNDLLKEGVRYFYKDKEGKLHWVDPEVAKNYKVKEGDPIKIVDGITTWSDYEIIGPSEDENTASNTNNSSKIDLTNEQKKKEPWLTSERLQELASMALPATRLFDSLRTNNRIADTLKKNNKLVLQNPYEVYSPVTGAFSEMQFRNKQANDLRRQAAQPYTSDASLNAARNLEANSQATNLEYQGKLADDKEIQRTKAEAFANSKESMLSRYKTAADNRDRIANWYNKNGSIEAQRLSSNWQSRDNYLQGIENKLNQRIAEEKNNKYTRAMNVDMANLSRQQSYRMLILDNYYLRKILDLSEALQTQIADWQKTNGEDNEGYKTQSFYKDAIEKMRKIQDEMLDQQNKLNQRHSEETSNFIKNVQNGTNFNNTSTLMNTEEPYYKIFSGQSLYRNGGKLYLK